MKKVLVPIFVFLFIALVSYAVIYEDFTKYTEVDTDGGITISSTRVTLSNVYTNYHDEYVYRDYGINYFGGDFTHYFTVNCAEYTQGDYAIVYVLANEIDDRLALKNGTYDHLCIFLWTGSGNNPNLYLVEFYGDGTNYETTAALSPPFTYYLTIIRNEAIGDYGQLDCEIYSDASRETGVDTLSLTLREKLDFRYLYPFSSYTENNPSHTWTGYVEYLDIGRTPSKNVIVTN